MIIFTEKQIFLFLSIGGRGRSARRNFRKWGQAVAGGIAATPSGIRKKQSRRDSAVRTWGTIY